MTKPKPERSQRAQLIEQTETLRALSWVDHHCHLGQDSSEALATIQNANDNGVKKLIDVGCDVAGSKLSVQRAAKHPNLYATAGLHPHQASQGTEGLEEVIASGGVVAVGECGLDFHYDYSERDDQYTAFIDQIGLAKKYDLPMVIHTRDAWSETFEILETHGAPELTIFHCFTGGVAELETCLKFDAYVSFSGILTFKNAAEIREAAVHCRPDRLLIETDSPYLAPVPYRSKKNEPANVIYVGAELARLRNSSVEDIARQCWQNTHRAYPGLEQIIT